jgi:hypothetical protein
VKAVNRHIIANRKLRDWENEQNGNERARIRSGPRESTDQTRLRVNEFVTGGWNVKTLSAKFPPHPETLNITQLLTPNERSHSASSAFRAGYTTQWIVHYKGIIKAPFTGKFRFVGAADDFLVVRFGKINVLDAGCTFVAQKAGTVYSDDVAAKMPSLGSSQKYPFTWHPGSVRSGRWINVEKGKEYEIEILRGDLTGDTHAFLAFETYSSKTGAIGKVILFRMEDAPPSEESFRGMGNDIDLSGGGFVWEARPAN